jgi:hypothetical protein
MNCARGDSYIICKGFDCVSLLFRVPVSFAPSPAFVRIHTCTYMFIILLFVASATYYVARICIRVYVGADGYSGVSAANCTFAMCARCIHCSRRGVLRTHCSDFTDRTTAIANHRRRVVRTRDYNENTYAKSPSTEGCAPG